MSYGKGLLVDEALSKTPRSSTQSISSVDDIFTAKALNRNIGDQFPSTVIDVDMGRQIGTNGKKTVSRNAIRIVKDNQTGIVITAIPINITN